MIKDKYVPSGILLRAHMKQSRQVFLVFFILVCFGVISNNQMAYGAFEFRGNGIVIFVAPGYQNDPINVGDTFEVNFFYDDIPVDIEPLPNVGTYEHNELSLRIGDSYWGDGDDCDAQVVDGIEGDLFTMSCSSSGEIGLDPINGAVFKNLLLTLADHEGDVFQDDSLPIHLEKIAGSFEERIVTLTYEDVIDGVPQQLFVVVDFSGAVDTDGDGIIDFWETEGFDKDLDTIIEVDFPGLGANPLHKDLFVEIDYMAGHKPSDKVINDVIAAFAAAPNDLVKNPDQAPGINLHIQVDEEIPHSDHTSMWTGFDFRRSLFFGTAVERDFPVNIEAKKLFYRYGIFIHQQAEDKKASGQAEIPGNDFVVSLGGFKNTDSNGHNTGSESQQSGALMHELGHTLSLRHGGNLAVNCKPNYASVMNYIFQFDEEKLVPGRPLDYSRETNPPIMENDLTESAGIIGPSDRETFVGGAIAPNFNDVEFFNIPIDFNKNGNSTDTGVSRDVNQIDDVDDCGPSPGETLTGYTDWSNLVYDFRGLDSFFGDGVHPILMEEITQDDLDAMIYSVFPAICQIPESGVWNITSSCELVFDSSAPENVTIQNNSVLTIPANVTLSIPQSNNITIEQGSGVLIMKDGTLQINS